MAQGGDRERDFRRETALQVLRDNGYDQVIDIFLLNIFTNY